VIFESIVGAEVDRTIGVVREMNENHDPLRFWWLILKTNTWEAQRRPQSINRRPELDGLLCATLQDAGNASESMDWSSIGASDVETLAELCCKELKWMTSFGGTK
jgi:hypothetical protein